MNGFQKYGLDAMGICDAESFNGTMIRVVREVFGNPEEEGAYTVLNRCLDELYGKAERITDGHCAHCAGSRIFTGTEKHNLLMQKLFDEISKVWHYKLEIVDGILIAKK